MKKNITYLLRVVLIVFVGAVALSPLFTNLAELEELGLTPRGYLPIVRESAPTSTPTPTNIPVGTSTPTPTNTPIPEADVRITFILYNPPGNDVPGEYIEFKNFGGLSQDITNWYLTNLDGFGPNGGEKVLHNYTFPSHVVQPGETFRVWTKMGIDSPPNFYWNSQTEVWMNDGDTATLRTDNAVVIDICIYAGGGQDTSC